MWKIEEDYKRNGDKMGISILVINSYELIPEYEDITPKTLKEIALVGEPKNFVIYNFMKRDLYTLAKLKTIHNIILPISIKVFRKKWYYLVKHLKIPYYYKKINVEFSTLSVDEKEDYLDEQGVEWNISRLMSNPRNVKLLNTLNTSNLYFVKKFIVHSKFAPTLNDRR